MIEPGVAPESTKYLLIPSALARRVFFYITRCGHYFCNNLYQFNCESEEGRVSSRKTFLLFYIRSGKMSLVFDGHQYKASSGQVVLMDCRYQQQYHALGDLEFIWLHFDGANARAFYDEITRIHGTVFRVNDENTIYQAAYDLVKSCAAPNSQSPYPEMQRSFKLLQFLSNLLLPRPVLKSPQNTLIESAQAFIQVHLADHLRVSDLAQEFGLSTSHFSRLFHEVVGMPPYEYIQNMRLSHAKELLMTTTLSIREIAFWVGYTNETAFTSIFTEKIGISPRNYRKLDKYLDL